MNRLHLLDLPADRLEGEAVAVFFFEDQRPLRGPGALIDWRLNGAVSRMVAAGRLGGRPGERLLLTNNGKLGTGWVLFAGGGRWSDLTEEDYRNKIVTLVGDCRRAGFGRFALALAALPGQGPAAVAAMVKEVLTHHAPEAECLLSVEEEDSGRGLSRRR